MRISGGAFQGCYNVVGGIDQVIPVNAYIPGCPPRPEAIIDGVVKLLSEPACRAKSTRQLEARACSTLERALARRRRSLARRAGP